MIFVVHDISSKSLCLWEIFSSIYTFGTMYSWSELFASWAILSDISNDQRNKNENED